MSALIVCSECNQPVEDTWNVCGDGFVHADRDLCARLKAKANSPFILAANNLGLLLHGKNTAYGSSYAKCGEFLRLLYPDGVKPEQYTDMLLLVRIFDKQMRIATAKNALNEDPFSDIAGYGLLGVVKDA